MDMNTLQYVVGEAKAGQPAVIRFFGRVTEDPFNKGQYCKCVTDTPQEKKHFQKCK